VIDLHTHSSVSDGSDAPAAIPHLAAAAQCSAVALTDHDRLDGIPAAQASADAVGVRLVPGCELSLEARGTMHLLVYFVTPGDGPLQTTLTRLQEARVTRNKRLATRLGELGLPVTYEEMVEEAGGDGVGRPHMAAILVRKGVVSSVQEAFDVWLAKGKPAYLDKERLLPADGLALAKASGGVAVLAHPLSLDLEPADLDRAVAELVELGLAGVEAIYGRYDGEQREAMAALATRHGLVVTGGSDHHGTYKPDLSVGTGRGDLEVPDSVLVALEERRPGP
jgi:predicted metal-dependent phosphoesterase TrpH